MIKISALPAAGTLTGTELVPIVKSGVTSQTTSQAVANLANVAAITDAATSKVTPVDADELPLADSATSYGLKKLLWSNLKATLKTYFDRLYMALVAPGTSGNLLVSNGSAWVSTAPTAAATVQTGSVFDYLGSTAPSGYVLLDGKTIGDGSSGGTERANADTVDLFTLLWNSMSDTEAPVSSGRGASAAADFAAHKTITLPDARGRTTAGKDNMGGSAANRLTAAGSGITGTTLGTAGGTETHTLTAAQLASHSHDENTGVYAGGGTGTTAMKYPTVNSGAGGLNYSGNTAGGADAVATVTTATAGSGNAHQNTQPTLVLNKIAKL